MTLDGQEKANNVGAVADRTVVIHNPRVWCFDIAKVEVREMLVSRTAVYELNTFF